MPDLEPITREEMLLDGQDLEPITRKEMFIKRIYDKTQVIPEPITREEMFLKKAGDETTDVTIEQLSVSENGTYSEEGVAYSPVIVNVPAPPIPDNAYLLNEVEDVPKDIATFSDGSNLPMPSLKVSIEPIQDLHGYDSPWVGGAGKNKLNLVAVFEGKGSYSADGSVYTLDSISGRPTVQFAETDGNYILTWDNTAYSGTATNVRLEFYNSAGTLVTSRYCTEVTPYALNGVCKVQVNYSGNGTLSIKNPMIRLASVTDATYAPYSNICPISGWDEVNVTRTGKNLFDKTIDVLNGYMTSDGTFRASNSGEKTFYCKVPKGTITMGKPVGTSVLRGVLFDSIPSNNDVGYEVLQYESNAKQTFTTTKETYYVCYCYNNTGETNTWQSVLDSIQVEIGNQATTYEPYNGQTYTIQFADGDNPLTVYGSSLDVVSGELKVVPYYASYNGETLEGEWISDRDVYAVGATPTIGAQVVNIGATPTTYQLTPTQVNSLLGSNNVWADTGKIEELEYFSKEV